MFTEAKAVLQSLVKTQTGERDMLERSDVLRMWE